MALGPPVKPILNFHLPLQRCEEELYLRDFRKVACPVPTVASGTGDKDGGRFELTIRVRTSFTVVGNGANSRAEPTGACAPPPTCSGLRTVPLGLANSSISRPTIIANKQGSWLTLMANGPMIRCK
jgi:hypothetical protein